MQYPQVLDYYFNLVNVRLPSENDPMIADPRFGAPKDPPRRVKERRESVEYREAPVKEHRKKERRRSRTGNTPPPVPMPDRYDRYR